MITVDAVVCRELTVELGGVKVVDGVSLAIERGEWLTIIGPNGAGKTTLLRAIAGLTAVDGTIEVDGASLRHLHARGRAQRIAYVAQTPVLPPGIAVFDYVLLGRTPHIPYLGAESAADIEAAREALELLDAVQFAPRVLESLSGGELQRVLLARALTQQAPVVLLDEPNTALDIGHQQEVLDVIDRLRRERMLTIVTTMHDLTLAGLYADRLVMLDHGRIVAEGTAVDVLTEANLERHYGARVRVIREGTGLVVVPQRRREKER
ncbi:MAG: cobalamin transport system ATP-binding protein [Actinomycetota bacterium]|nr:cobalamin transport system ATP-binding protein [Actinomycetota bacterium]